MMENEKICFEFVDSIDSTNDELKRRLNDENTLKGFFVLSADTQTGGRGRMGHVWASPKGVSISTSMIIYPDGIRDDAIARITIVAACAVSSAIEEMYGLKPGIKWPNDVLINDKKICGILTERIICKDDVSAVIIGIGINAFKGSYPDELRDMATSIDEELLKTSSNDKVIDRKEIIMRLWRKFVRLYEDFLKSRDVGFLLDYYNERLVNTGKRVVVSDGGTEYNAYAIGIDSGGRLLADKDDGSRIAIDSGEVHIRGIYGYV